MRLIAMNSETARPAFPDGLGDGHVTSRRSLHRHASPAALAVLGLLLLAALLGLFGGGRAQPIRDDGKEATLKVSVPRTLRNGMIFEIRIKVKAKALIAEPKIAVSEPLWRDLTINSHYPDPKDQSFKNGSFEFSHEPMKRDDSLEIKLDGQINPALTRGTKGAITLFDGDHQIASVPISIKVLP